MPRKQVSPRDKILDKAVSIYLEGLKDPNNPSYCGVCLAGLICRILPSDSGAHHDVLARHHAFWDKSIAFLTMHRTDEDLEHLLQRLARCDCPSNDHYLHDLHSTFVRTEEQWFERGGSFVSQDPSRIARARFPRLLLSRMAIALTSARPKTVARGGKAVWPQVLTDLIPFGGETTALAMVQWHRAMDNDLTVFAVLRVMVRICRTLIMPHIATSALPALMVTSGRALFDRTNQALDSANLDERRRSANTFFQQALHLDSFLMGLMKEGIGQVPFARGNETKLVQLCNLFVHIATDPRLPRMRPAGDFRPRLFGCTTWASNSYRMFHMYLPPRPPIVLHPDVAEFDKLSFPPEETIRDLREMVHTALGATRKDMQCAALDCTGTLQSSGKAFMRCSRCCIPCYCGKACQTRAWKEEKHPHRLICPIFRELVRFGGEAATDLGPSSRHVALERWARAPIPEADFQLVYDWFQLKNVAPNALMPNGTEWRPGFDDYDEIVGRFGADGIGPKSVIVNPLARWPSEIAKAKAAHQELPFYLEEII
ncbi:hypothetical protein B0H15DRAFT_285426 [Mycena belliarum]|uniref:MYND-type domain-containing protein n=1 Tax=Mycena belliarum TaxID=1033014 RepID=A0AAD6U465_9AGAR|nr:hypothetical protein B0H15DRAFT_285426 [Mycena belliae]